MSSEEFTVVISGMHDQLSGGSHWFGMSGTKLECISFPLALLWDDEASEVTPHNEEEEVAVEDQESIVE